MTQKTKAKPIDWKARAKKAERVAKAAVEFEYRYFKSAASPADKKAEQALEELTWTLRDTGMIKRD